MVAVVKYPVRLSALRSPDVRPDRIKVHKDVLGYWRWHCSGTVGHSGHCPVTGRWYGTWRGAMAGAQRHAASFHEVFL